MVPDWARWCDLVEEVQGSCEAARKYGMKTAEADCGMDSDVDPTPAIETTSVTIASTASTTSSASKTSSEPVPHCARRHDIRIQGHSVDWNMVPDWARWCDLVEEVQGSCEAARKYGMKTAEADCGMDSDVNPTPAIESVTLPTKPRCATRGNLLVDGSVLEWHNASDWASWCDSVEEEQGSCEAARSFAMSVANADCGIGEEAVDTGVLTCHQKDAVILESTIKYWDDVPEWRRWCDELIGSHSSCEAALQTAQASAHCDCGIVL
ncbi:MAG: uncharacterized protein KVP18_003390 [Porospora cf. gigantea A]|uniref:uncharacterized protein n=1 Tax=Porospora cf. gigantea A TaxID=2853593 RepID=UPI00355A0FFD|nr:MAG: hypothetical protein KVP18_003390 [Porospora cf. gigantea A]